MQWVGE